MILGPKTTLINGYLIYLKAICNGKTSVTFLRMNRWQKGMSTCDYTIRIWEEGALLSWLDGIPIQRNGVNNMDSSEERKI